MVTKLIEHIAERDNLSLLQAEMLVNHTKYLINRLLSEFRIDEATSLVNDILGMSSEEAGKLERGER